MRYDRGMAQEAPGLRERKMLRVRSQLVDAALRLFTVRGFEGTTVDDIVQEVEVSRRTFFRYFDSKEDVVLAFTDRAGEEISAGLAARPPGEPPLTAVRAALGRLVALYDAERDRALVLAKLTGEAVGIRARHLDRQDRWQRRLAEDIAKRLRVDASRHLQPSLVAAIALTTVDVAVRAWLASGGRGSLAAFVDEAFAALDALDRPLPPEPKRGARTTAAAAGAPAPSLPPSEPKPKPKPKRATPAVIPAVAASVAPTPKPRPPSAR
jgi:AcrR family transcriptional regulator